VVLHSDGRIAPIPDSTGQTAGTDCSDGFAAEAQRREQKHRQCGQIGASPANAHFLGRCKQLILRDYPGGACFTSDLLQTCIAHPYIRRCEHGMKRRADATKQLLAGCRADIPGSQDLKKQGFEATGT
jgi:hypothetical protein